MKMRVSHGSIENVDTSIENMSTFAYLRKGSGLGIQDQLIPYNWEIPKKTLPGFHNPRKDTVPIVALKRILVERQINTNKLAQPSSINAKIRA
jgi:hypothetical protein